MPYFYYPFAVGGDLTAVPLPTQISGSISYQQGWGPDYELNLLTNPAAFPIGRQTTNQVFNDITTAIQFLQQYGTPAFITTSDNQGTPFPYPIYARVYYSGAVYENQVAGNVVLPGTDSSWLAISGDSTGILPGTMLDYAGFTAPAGYLTCDGSAHSRSTYSVLMSIITQTQTGTTTNTMDTVSGLTSTAQMYIGMPLESANFPPGTTVLTIVDANNITASANATAGGSVSIQFFNWGNGDGSTTFNVPDSRRKTNVGQGGTPTSELGSVVGQTGGEETHTMQVAELATHSHTFLGYTTGFSDGNNPSSVNLSGPVTESTNTTGSSTPFNVIQPSDITYKIIKT